MATDQVHQFTDANFQSEVIESDVPVLVDFWAPWCGPCRALAPIIDQIANEFADQLKVGKVNTDENFETASKLQISSIPALFIFKGGEIVNRVVGAVPKSKIVAAFQDHL